MSVQTHPSKTSQVRVETPGDRETGEVREEAHEKIQTPARSIRGAQSAEHQTLNFGSGHEIVSCIRLRTGYGASVRFSLPLLPHPTSSHARLLSKEKNIFKNMYFYKYIEIEK